MAEPYLEVFRPLLSGNIFGPKMEDGHDKGVVALEKLHVARIEWIDHRKSFTVLEWSRRCGIPWNSCSYPSCITKGVPSQGMETGHTIQIVERERLYPVRPERVLHQTLWQSLDDWEDAEYLEIHAISYDNRSEKSLCKNRKCSR